MSEHAIRLVLLICGQWSISIIVTLAAYEEGKNCPDDRRTWSRWGLVTIFFGWLIIPILICVGIRQLWRAAELPALLSFRRGEVKQDAGSLSFPDKKR